MKKRPLSIYILVVLHLLAPVFTVILSRVLKSEPIAIDNLFTAERLAINWPGYLLQVLCAICIYLCKRWSMVLYLIFMTALFAFSYQNFSDQGSNGSIALLILCWVINIAVVFYFLRPSLRQVYTDPKLRWWEHSKRYVSSYNAAFTYKEVRGDGQIVNLSKTGLLLKTNIELTNYSHIDLLVDIGDEKLPITGEVIVHEQIKNGFGIKFDKTSANKTSAKKIIKKLKNNQPIP